MVEGRVHGLNEVGFLMSELLCPSCLLGAPRLPEKGQPWLFSVFATLWCCHVFSSAHNHPGRFCVLAPGSDSSHGTYPQKSDLVGYIGRVLCAVQPWAGIVPAAHTGLI